MAICGSIWIIIKRPKRHNHARYFFNNLRHTRTAAATKYLPEQICFIEMEVREFFFATRKANVAQSSETISRVGRGVGASATGTVAVEDTVEVASYFVGHISA